MKIAGKMANVQIFTANNMYRITAPRQMILPRPFRLFFCSLTSNGSKRSREIYDLVYSKTKNMFFHNCRG